MLDNTGTRQLCYVVKIDDIKPVLGSDNCECAVVNGWTILVRKNTFEKNSLAIYFEIDSHVDTTKPEFTFLEKKHGNIKTQKYTFGGKNPGFYSQGLLMGAEDFGWKLHEGLIIKSDGKVLRVLREGDFLTQELGVTYADPDDNKRKAKVNPDARINNALAKHPKIAKKYGKLIKKNKFLRWIFLAIYGRKKPSSWPVGVPKTDEERIENRPWTLDAHDVKWIATEKIDGTSTTFYFKKGKGFSKPEYLVCSRNVVFDTPDKKNYYSDSIGNVYLEMSEKYHMRKVLERLLEQRPSAEWVAVQAETFGAGVQKRDYGMKDHEIRAFNLRYSDCGRVGTLQMRDELEPLGVPVVPILSEGMCLPSTIDNLREFVHATPSKIDGGMREGIVFRTLDGADSFKCVDPEFLLKYHQ